MRHAAREAPDGFHLLNLAESLFETLAIVDLCLQRLLLLVQLAQGSLGDQLSLDPDPALAIETIPEPRHFIVFRAHVVSHSFAVPGCGTRCARHTGRLLDACIRAE